MEKGEKLVIKEPARFFFQEWQPPSPLRERDPPFSTGKSVRKSKQISPEEIAFYCWESAPEGRAGPPDSFPENWTTR
jgi:hypothetical protein